MTTLRAEEIIRLVIERHAYLRHNGGARLSKGGIDSVARDLISLLDLERPRRGLEVVSALRLAVDARGVDKEGD